MIFNRTLTFCAALLLSAVVATPAFATNGYFTHGTGTKNKGMAGAGIATQNDAISIANNPAAAVFAVGQLDVGAAVFSPSRSYSSSDSAAMGNGGAFTIGPNDLDSNMSTFVIPHIAYSWGLGEDSALGVAFYGRGGMNTKWVGGDATFDPDGPAGPAPIMTLPGTFGAGTAGVDLSQAFLDIAYARKAGDRFAWGVSLVVVVQAFEATGVDTFAGFTESFLASGGTELPSNLSGNGHEISSGFGGKLGFQFALSERISLAAMYQTEIGMSEFDDYADLFAKQGSFDIPANFKLGLTFGATDNLSISLDMEQIWYSDVDAVGNPMANLFTCPSLNPMSMELSGCLGGDNGAGFGWDDMSVVKVGAEWNNGGDWTWRAGYSHGSQPIADSEILFNILAPATIEDHVAFGFTKKQRNNNELNVSLMYAFDNNVSGTNPFDPTQTIDINMDQWELEVSYSWRF